MDTPCLHSSEKGFHKIVEWQIMEMGVCRNLIPFKQNEHLRGHYTDEKPEYLAHSWCFNLFPKVFNRVESLHNKCAKVCL